MLDRRLFLTLGGLALAHAATAQGLRERWAERRAERRAAPASAPGARDEPGTDALRWTDAARQRELPLRLRLPAGADRVPLVLFSHGLGGSVDAGRAWAQAWADAGIATLHLQHPGSDTEVLRHGGPRALQKAANADQLEARALDVRFVLDELARRQAAGDALLARLRLDAIGMAGHSFGGHTTLAVAGQSYGRRGPAPLADPRPRAFAAFSPSPPARGEGGFGGIERPVLCLTGSFDTDPFASAGSERATRGDYRRQVYDALPSGRGRKAELWLDGADHASFSGNAQGQRSARPRPDAAVAQSERHHALIRATSTDWWRAHLLDDADARQRLSQAPAGLGPQDAWRTA
jgi:dienelactone hydrolase